MSFEFAQSLFRAHRASPRRPGLRLKLQFMVLVDQDALTNRTLALDAFRRNLRLLEKKVLGQSFLYSEIRDSLATLFADHNPARHRGSPQAGSGTVAIQPVKHEYRKSTVKSHDSRQA
jgi:hypothetical protein